MCCLVKMRQHHLLVFLSVLLFSFYAVAQENSPNDQNKPMGGENPKEDISVYLIVDYHKKLRDPVVPQDLEKEGLVQSIQDLLEEHGIKVSEVLYVTLREKNTNNADGSVNESRVLYGPPWIDLTSNQTVWYEENYRAKKIQNGETNNPLYMSDQRQDIRSRKIFLEHFPGDGIAVPAFYITKNQKRAEEYDRDKNQILIPRRIVFLLYDEDATYERLAKTVRDWRKRQNQTGYYLPCFSPEEDKYCTEELRGDGNLLLLYVDSVRNTGFTLPRLFKEFNIKAEITPETIDIKDPENAGEHARDLGFMLKIRETDRNMISQVEKILLPDTAYFVSDKNYPLQFRFTPQKEEKEDLWEMTMVCPSVVNTEQRHRVKGCRCLQSDYFSADRFDSLPTLLQGIGRLPFSDEYWKDENEERPFPYDEKISCGASLCGKEAQCEVVLDPPITRRLTIEWSTSSFDRDRTLQLLGASTVSLNLDLAPLSERLAGTVLLKNTEERRTISDAQNILSMIRIRAIAAVVLFFFYLVLSVLLIKFHFRGKFNRIVAAISLLLFFMISFLCLLSSRGAFYIVLVFVVPLIILLVFYILWLCFIIERVSNKIKTANNKPRTPFIPTINDTYKLPPDSPSSRRAIAGTITAPARKPQGFNIYILDANKPESALWEKLCFQNDNVLLKLEGKVVKTRQEKIIAKEVVLSGYEGVRLISGGEALPAYDIKEMVGGEDIAKEIEEAILCISKQIRANEAGQMKADYLDSMPYVIFPFFFIKRSRRIEQEMAAIKDPLKRFEAYDAICHFLKEISSHEISLPSEGLETTPEMEKYRYGDWRTICKSSVDDRRYREPGVANPGNEILTLVEWEWTIPIGQPHI